MLSDAVGCRTSIVVAVSSDQSMESRRRLEAVCRVQPKNRSRQKKLEVGSIPSVALYRSSVHVLLFCDPVFLWMCFCLPRGCRAHFFAETLTRRCRQQFFDRSMASIDFSPRVQLRVPNPEPHAGPRVVFLY
jgi:hypothetical protein